MVLFKELQESFLKHLRSLLDLTAGKSEEEVNEILIEQADSEEEKRVIREIYEEIDLEHQLTQDLENSEMDPGEWLENQIENGVKELIPDATTEDIETVKEKVAECMEEEIKYEAEEFDKEISELESLIERTPNQENSEEA